MSDGASKEPETPNAEDSMEGYVGPDRQRFDETREGITHRVQIGGMDGYITANRFEDGRLGEIFIHGFGALGSTNAGWTNAFAIMVSISLQFGTELPMLARKFAHMRFEPNGETDNPKIPHCHSIPDYIFKWIASHEDDGGVLFHQLMQIDHELRR